MKGVAAGSNLEMPSPGLHSARELIAAVENGSLSMEELETNVDDLLEAVLALTGNRENKGKSFDKEGHHKLAQKAEEESIVLLKNEDELLPLKPGCKVALIGDFAFTPRYQGAGSSLVNPIRVENMEEMIRDYPLGVAGCARGYSRGGKTDVTLRDEALKLAAQADVVLYCFGLDEISESEGMDRIHMGIPQNQISLLTALSEVNPNVVGILSAGSAIEMPWQECCKSLLHGYLGGEAGPSAMLRVITGEVNPSGRLSETYPLRHEDTPAYRYFPGAERCSQYREGIYVGYRYYDTGKIKVQYPFGYGLSYTTFSYKDLEVLDNEVRFTLTNTGRADGKEVVQLYVGGPKGRIFRPEKELKGFKKVFLKAGESKVITIPFDDKTFRFWNRLTNRFEVEGGVYSIFIGANVADIRMLQIVTREGTTEDWPYKAETLKSYYTGRISQVPEKEFETLLGHPVPEGKWSGDLSLNDALCQMYYAKSPLARLVWRILTGLKNKSEEKGKPDLNLLFIYNMPFRGIAKMTGGAVSMDMAEGMVLAVNGHFFRGMRRIIGGYFANAKANRAYEKKLSGK